MARRKKKITRSPNPLRCSVPSGGNSSSVSPCPCCGSPIDPNAPTDIGAYLPDPVFFAKLGGAKEGTDFVYDGSVCAWAEPGNKMYNRFFIRTFLEIPCAAIPPKNKGEGLDRGGFRFGVWVEVSKEKSEEFLATRNDESLNGPYSRFSLEGTVATELCAPYTGSSGSKVRAYVADPRFVPSLAGGPKWLEDAVMFGLTHEGYKDLVREIQCAGITTWRDDAECQDKEDPS